MMLTAPALLKNFSRLGELSHRLVPANGSPPFADYYYVVLLRIKQSRYLYADLNL